MPGLFNQPQQNTNSKSGGLFNQTTQKPNSSSGGLFKTVEKPKEVKVKAVIPKSKINLPSYNPDAPENQPKWFGAKWIKNLQESQIKKEYESNQKDYTDLQNGKLNIDTFGLDEKQKKKAIEDYKAKVTQNASIPFDQFRLNKYQNEENPNWTPSANPENRVEAFKTDNPVLNFVQRTLNKGINTITMDDRIETPTTGSKIANTISDIGGTVLGYGVNPAGVDGSLLNLTQGLSKPVERAIAGKVASKTGGKVLNRILPALGREFIEGSTGALLEGTARKMSPKDIGKKMLVEGGIGAALGGTFEGAGALLNKYKPTKALNKALDSTPTKAPDVVPSVTPIKSQKEWVQTLQKRTDLKPIEKEVAKAKALNEAIYQPKLDIPIKDNNLTLAKNADTIKKPILGKDEEISKFYSNSLMEGEVLSKEGKQALNEMEYVYGVKHNKDSLKKAQDLLNANGVENEASRLMSNGLNSAEDSMTHYLVTKELMNEAKVAGDFTKLNDYLEVTRPSITNSGQIIQALSEFKKSTPEGAILNAQNVIENAKKGLKETNPKVIEKAEKEIAKLPKDNLIDFEKAKSKILKNNNIPNLSNADSQFIVDTMAKAQALTGRAKDVEVAKVMQLIGDKIPSSLAEKFKGWQRISLLLNPKTNVRNILGNSILGTMENAKDLIGTPLDMAISLKTGKRTTTLPNLLTQGKGMLQGAKETLQDAKLGIDTAATRGQYELPQGKTFNNKILNKLDKATKTALELGDRPFYTGYYNDRLNQLMKLNKVDKPTKDIIEQATEFAKDRTLQNDSNIAKGMKWIQQGLNKVTGNKDLGIGTFSLPFVRTPSNLLDKAVDYSPLVLTKIAKQLSNIPKGTFNQKAFVDEVARGVTGTAAIMLGYDLAKKGHLTGKYNKDKDVNSLEQQAGKTPYSIKAGDKYYTVDFLQPIIVPLMVGADIYSEGKTRKDATGIVASAIKSGGETLFKQSLLTGVQKLFGGYTPLQGIEDVAKSIPGQFTPSALKQVAQLTDKNVRNTYDANPLNKTLNTVKAKIPGLSKTLQPKIDTLGREVKFNQGNNSLFNVALNPGVQSTYKPTDGEKLILALYDKTGDTTIFPRVAPIKIKGKSLTPQQVTDLQKEMGAQTLELLNILANSQAFKNSTTKYQIKHINSKLNDIADNSRKKILPKELLK